MHLNNFFSEKGSVGLTRLSKGSMAQIRLRTPALDGEQGVFIQRKTVYQ